MEGDCYRGQVNQNCRGDRCPIGHFDGFRYMSALLGITSPCEIKHTTGKNLREIRRTGSPILHPER